MCAGVLGISFVPLKALGGLKMRRMCHVSFGAISRALREGGTPTSPSAASPKLEASFWDDTEACVMGMLGVP